MRLLVTGASGFIGREVVRRAVRDSDSEVRAAARGDLPPFSGAVKVVQAPNLRSDSDWTRAVDSIDVVVHTAARVHILRETVADPLAEFRRVNVEGTLTLARQATQAGVRRFLFLSSIGVNGAETFNRPFTADDPPAPCSTYAVSKREAESGLRRIAEETGLEVVIVRPPLVYGPCAPGNFGRLFRFVGKGIPLPLGAIHNRRSLVALDNLVDLLIVCLAHPAAANQILLVRDGEDLSTTALLRRCAAALGAPARLFPVPAKALRKALEMLGRGELAQQLCGSLQIDDTKTRTLLDWAPPTSVNEALQKAASLLDKHRAL